MNKFVKRIQSRLSRKDIKVSASEIRAIYTQLVADVEAPTDDEINAVVNSFINPVDSNSTEIQTTETKVTDMQEPDASKESLQEITTEETAQMESTETNESVEFNNNFEKAGAIQQVFTNNGIVASDVELIGISGQIENKFDDHNQFMVTALVAWKDYCLQNNQKNADEVMQLLADIRTNETVHANNINNSMSATAQYINDVRANQKQQFVAFIDRMKNS